MLQVRKLVMAVAAATALTSGMAHALGLGNVSVKSSLNQPFEAEIELLETAGLTELELKTQLASPEDFSQAGIDRQFFLTNLKFTPIIRADGRNVIRVTSERPVREPYLNFLVEVLWPNGRILREYTVLLDPPLYKPQEVVYVPAATDKTAATAQRQAPAKTASPAAPKARPAKSAPSAKPVVAGEQYQVAKNDSLWAIASRVEGAASVHQAMLAIHELNPQAFINGDLNRLKAGQVLNLPTEAQMQKRSRAQALAEFRSRNNVVASQPQLDARQRTSAGSAPAQVAQQDSLRLVATETGQSATGGERGVTSQGGGASGIELAQAKEMLDSTRRENQDLREQLDELNAQVEKLQKIIELKNSQLATLQYAEEVSSNLPVEPSAGEVQVSEEAVSTELVTEGRTPDDFAVVEEAAQPEAAPAPAPAPEPKPEPEPVQPKPAPVVYEPPVQTSFMDDLLANPLALPAIGGGSILLLTLLWLAAKRRKKKAEQEQEQEENFAETPVEASAFDGDNLPDVEEDLAGFAEDSFDVVETVQEAPAKGAANNVITEAESYIAFGRFNQAADILMQAVDQEPQRLDLRMKLIEVLADLEDKRGFAHQMDELVAMGVAASELDAIRSRYPHLVDSSNATALADEEYSLEDLGLETPDFAMEQVETELTDDDFSDLPSLDDLESELSDANVGAEQEAEFEIASFAETLADAEQTATDAENSDMNDLELDDLLLELSEPAAEEAVEKPAAEEFSFEPFESNLGDDKSENELDLDIDSLFAENEAPEQVATENPILEELDDFAASLEGIDSDLALAEEPTNELDALDTLSSELPVADTELSFDFDEVAPISSDEQADSFSGLDSVLEDDDFSFLAGTDESTTKLDLAQAYIDMGDAEGAKDILEEVLTEGSPEQQQRARELMKKLD